VSHGGTWSRAFCDALARDIAEIGYRPALAKHGVSADAAYAGFRRNGLAGPSTFSRRGAPVADLGWDDDETAANETRVAVPEPEPGEHVPAAVPAADRVWVDRRPEPEPRPVVTGMDTWVIFPDCHIPFEDHAAYGLVLDVCRHLRPYGCILIGDYADMLSVSSHPRTPMEQRWQLKDEVDAVRARRAELDGLGFQRKIITSGNHEGRGQSRAMEQMIGLYDSLDPDYLFGYSANGWEFYPYRRIAKVGKAHFVHDLRYCGVNAVRQNALLAQASIITGHTHAAECRYFGNVLGVHHVSMSVGWLGSFEAAAYMDDIRKAANWQHAFGIMRVEHETQNVHCKLHPIVDYRVEVDGQLFAA
jgi:hypothetical protein